MAGKDDHLSSPQHHSGVAAAKSGEHLQHRNEPDPFPPEGTDDKMVQPGDIGDKPLSDAEATKATQSAINRGMSKGKAQAG